MKKLNQWPSFVTLLSLACSASGCSKNNLPNYWQLGGLRVLGIVAATPEVNPTAAGVAVTLNAIISDYNAGGRTLQWSVQECVDPGIGLGANPTCASGPTSSGTLNTSTLNSKTFTGTLSFGVTVPQSIFTSLPTIAQFNGVNYLAILTLSGSNGDSITAFKRIIASTKPTPNNNPLLTSITSAGSALTNSLPNTIADLTAVIPASSTEGYQVENSDGTFQTLNETLEMSWFVNFGSLQYSRTDSTSPNSYQPPSISSSTIFLIAVLHDSRGGTAFQYIGP